MKSITTILTVCLIGVTVDPAAAQSPDEPIIESRVFDVESEADSFYGKLGDVGAELPEGFGRQVDRLRELAAEGRTDPEAAAEFHNVQSQVMTGLAVSLQRVLVERPEVEAELARYGEALGEGRVSAEVAHQTATAELTAAEVEAGDRRQDLVEVAVMAKRLRDAGRELPTDLQRRLRIAKRELDIARQDVEGIRRDAREQERLVRVYDALEEDLLKQKQQLEDYWAWCEADHRLLQRSAAREHTVVEALRLKNVLLRGSPGKPRRNWRALIDFAGESQSASVAETRAADNTDNAAEVAAIIAEFGREELLEHNNSSAEEASHDNE